MGGAVPPLPLYAFMVWAGTTLPVSVSVQQVNLISAEIVFFIKSGMKFLYWTLWTHSELDWHRSDWQQVVWKIFTFLWAASCAWWTDMCPAVPNKWQTFCVRCYLVNRTVCEGVQHKLANFAELLLCAFIPNWFSTSPDTIRVIKLWRIRWGDHVSSMGRGVDRCIQGCDGKTWRKGTTWKTRVDGSVILKWACINQLWGLGLNWYDSGLG
jgi:hypothetical protein